MMIDFSFRSLVLLSVLSWVCTQTPQYHSGLFSKQELSSLNTSPFKKLRVHSYMDCAFPCARSQICLSFNVDSTVDPLDGLRACELLDLDKENSPQLFSKNGRFHHYSRVWRPCEKPQCLNGARCVVNDMGTGYHCDCQSGFMGINCESVKWIKLNTKEVSFGAKNDQFGPFNITVSGELITMKLVWRSGYITIKKDKEKAKSHWYSNDPNSGAPLNILGVIVTDATPGRTRILPLNKDTIIGTNEYKLPGYNSMSPYIIYKNFTTPYKVTVGQEFQIWFSQDRDDVYEDTNDGICYVDVYGLYV